MENKVLSNEMPINEPKKRGRKKASEKVKVPETTEVVEKVHKKRGRKPKGGKIIMENDNTDEKTEQEPNVILHLKCKLSDIQSNEQEDNSINEKSSNNNNITKSDNSSITQIQYNPNVENIVSFNYNESSFQKVQSEELFQNNDELPENENDATKQIWKKINALKFNLHKNNISDKRSDCFWCSHGFNNPPIFIPKCKIKESYDVYGCFCTPECAVAFLMKENIDSSLRFERYQLLNNIYGTIYNHEKNIKPAPDPYYLLDKYYGNLSIQEYRKLLNNDQVLIVVDKPLTHVFPELYEDNNDFLLNTKTIPSNSCYQVKKKTLNKKTELLENLGISK